MYMSKHGHKSACLPLFVPIGLEASDPVSWAQGPGVISGFIDQLEGMEA